MRGFFSYCFVFLLSLMSHNTWAYTSEDCMNCHREESAESILHISIKDFQASIHGSEITCQDCHTGVKDEAHEGEKGSGAVDCNECHDQENRHGIGSKKKHPQCYTCHRRHSTLSKDNENSSVHPDRLTQTCKECHPVECGKTNYLTWLPSLRIATHNKQDLSQAYEKRNCIGCHQGEAAHGGQEPINDQGCYECHLSKNGNSALWGYIHPKADLNEQPVIFAAAALYQISMVALMYGLLKFLFGKFYRRTKRRE